mmetsp:Transcript_73985/g.111447  ORF Transcript_73985/g.111447 Transcript_73985/m.111447 type:complete len:325 (-) Transcript_73985:2-976(-)
MFNASAKMFGAQNSPPHMPHPSSIPSQDPMQIRSPFSFLVPSTPIPSLVPERFPQIRPEETIDFFPSLTKTDFLTDKWENFSPELWPGQLVNEAICNNSPAPAKIYSEFIHPTAQTPSEFELSSNSLESQTDCNQMATAEKNILNHIIPLPGATKAIISVHRKKRKNGPYSESSAALFDREIKNFSGKAFRVCVGKIRKVKLDVSGFSRIVATLSNRKNMRPTCFLSKVEDKKAGEYFELVFDVVNDESVVFFYIHPYEYENACSLENDLCIQFFKGCDFVASCELNGITVRAHNWEYRHETALESMNYVHSYNSLTNTFEVNL